MLYMWWYQGGVIYYDLLKPNKKITGERYLTEMMRWRRALREKWTQHKPRHDSVILQHESDWPDIAQPVKDFLDT